MEVDILEALIVPFALWLWVGGEAELIRLLGSELISLPISVTAQYHA
jgi:hypothetical protein